MGYGSTRIDGQPVTADTPSITESDARALMLAELTPICATVKSRAPEDASANEIAACTSFSYNVGIAAFLGSTLLHDWGFEDPEMAAQEFMKWRFDHDPITHQLAEVPGLKNRRLKEQAVFLGAAP